MNHLNQIDHAYLDPDDALYRPAIIRTILLQPWVLPNIDWKTPTSGLSIGQATGCGFLYLFQTGFDEMRDANQKSSALHKTRCPDPDSTRARRIYGAGRQLVSEGGHRDRDRWQSLVWMYHRCLWRMADNDLLVSRKFGRWQQIAKSSQL